MRNCGNIESTHTRTHTHTTDTYIYMQLW